MTELYPFGAAFVLVFALGVQQQNVTGRHYVAAIVTSIAIGSAQIFLWRITPTASAAQIVATLLGGAVGIVAAMYIHPRITQRWGRRT